METIEEGKENKIEKEEIEELSPKKFAEFIGQTRLKEVIENYISFHKEKHRVMDHILLTGPAGLGKSTVAKMIANEMEVGGYRTTGPALRKLEDIIPLLDLVKQGDVIFIDEIHRLNKNVEHFLYVVMTDFHYNVTIKISGEWESFSKNVSKFTLIGATTAPGELSKPFLQRFGLQERLEFYSLDELVDIIYRSAKILGIEIFREGALGIANRSRFTPRKANQLLKRISEYAWKIREKELTAEIVDKASIARGIDEIGLDNIDRAYLRYLANQRGGPSGIDNIAKGIDEDKKTIEELQEPYLVKIGFVKKTPKGRVLLPAAFKYLGLDMEEIIYKDKKGMREVIGGKQRWGDEDIMKLPTKAELKKRVSL